MIRDSLLWSLVFQFVPICQLLNQHLFLIINKNRSRYHENFHTYLHHFIFHSSNHRYRMNQIPFPLLHPRQPKPPTRFPSKPPPPSQKRVKGGINCPHLNSLCSYSYCDENNNNCATRTNPDCLNQHIDPRTLSRMQKRRPRYMQLYLLHERPSMRHGDRSKMFEVI